MKGSPSLAPLQSIMISMLQLSPTQTQSLISAARSLCRIV